MEGKGRPGDFEVNRMITAPSTRKWNLFRLPTLPEYAGGQQEASDWPQVRGIHQMVVSENGPTPDFPILLAGTTTNNT